MMSKVVTKNASYWIFLGYYFPRICQSPKFSKNYCHSSNQHNQICQYGKFCERTMMSTVVTKDALFGIIWAIIF